MRDVDKVLNILYAENYYHFLTTYVAQTSEERVHAD